MVKALQVPPHEPPIHRRSLAPCPQRTVQPLVIVVVQPLRRVLDHHHPPITRRDRQRIRVVRENQRIEIHVFKPGPAILRIDPPVVADLGIDDLLERLEAMVEILGRDRIVPRLLDHDKLTARHPVVVGLLCRCTLADQLAQRCRRHAALQRLREHVLEP